MSRKPKDKVKKGVHVFHQYLHSPSKSSEHFACLTPCKPSFWETKSSPNEFSDFGPSAPRTKVTLFWACLCVGLCGSKLGWPIVATMRPSRRTSQRTFFDYMDP